MLKPVDRKRVGEHIQRTVHRFKERILDDGIIPVVILEKDCIAGVDLLVVTGKEPEVVAIDQTVDSVHKGALEVVRDSGSLIAELALEEVDEKGMALAGPLHAKSVEARHETVCAALINGLLKLTQVDFSHCLLVCPRRYTVSVLFLVIAHHMLGEDDSALLTNAPSLLRARTSTQIGILGEVLHVASRVGCAMRAAAPAKETRRLTRDI